MVNREYVRSEPYGAFIQKLDNLNAMIKEGTVSTALGSRTHDRMVGHMEYTK